MSTPAPLPFHHPSRPRLANGQPCWLGTHQALPVVLVEPQGDGLWEIMVMLRESGEEASHWHKCGGVELGQLSEFLAHWALDPEGALGRWFGVSPPGSPQQAAANAEDLGL